MKLIVLFALAVLIYPAAAAKACEGFNTAMSALEQVVAEKQHARQTMTPTTQMTVEALRKESLNRSLTRLEQAVMTSYENKTATGTFATRARAQ